MEDRKASPMSGTSGAGGKRKLGTGIVLLILALVGASLYGRELLALVPRAAERIAALGAWGPLIFALAYALATVLFLPGSLATLLAGALFGITVGTLTAFAGATLGACAAFLIARHLARDWVARRLERHDALARIDRSLADQGLRIVVLLRLSPLFPFNALNFMLALTRVRFRDFALGSLGMVPGTLLYVYYGKLVGDVAQIAAGARPAGRGPEYWAVLALGLLATIAVSVLVARQARRALDARIGEPATVHECGERVQETRA